MILTRQQRHDAYAYVYRKLVGSMRMWGTVCPLLSDWLALYLDQSEQDENWNSILYVCTIPYRKMVYELFPEFAKFDKPGRLLWFDDYEDRLQALRTCMMQTITELKTGTDEKDEISPDHQTET